MKKVFAFCLTMLLVVSMSVSVFAAPGNFVSSPSNNQAPDLVGSENENDECTAQIKITSYAERDTLPEDVKAKLEAAYDQIVNGDVATLLAKLAEEKNIPVERLACSDLFDISYFGCAEHKNHGYITITLKAETLKNFVGLLHLYNGEWEIIDNATVGSDGATLTFKVDDFSPFAIIVEAEQGSGSMGDGSGSGTGDDSQSGSSDGDKPQTGDRSMTSVWVILMVTSALMLILVAVKRKKASAE